MVQQARCHSRGTLRDAEEGGGGWRRVKYTLAVRNCTDSGCTPDAIGEGAHGSQRTCRAGGCLAWREARRNDIDTVDTL